MKDAYILCHYGELGTKGDNRKLFLKELAKNIRHALKTFPTSSLSYDHDHAYVDIGEEDVNALLNRLREISGLQRLSIVKKTDKEFNNICEAALEIIKQEEGKTFKVITKRSDKTYPLDSMEISRKVGGFILKNTSLSVDVHKPDISLNIELRKEATYLYAHSFPGAGGYPLGMNGKVMMMLSGGIDSPVASYALLRRGIKIECIHFAAPPYTSDAVLDKLKDILTKLSIYQCEIKLHIIPFTKLQLAIYQNTDEPYCITLMRRMMYRLATSLAKKTHCLAIANGESIGQVASQTLNSLIAINDVTSFPVIRPLATFDKLDIISLAKKIDTYDISIRPYEDCCTIFKPKKPKTKPSIEECLYFEEKFPYESLIEEALNETKTIIIKEGVEE